MTSTTGLLLVIALCVGSALSLKCYTCNAQSTNTNCMTATNCSATDTNCMTSVFAGGIGSLSGASITKTCTAVCTETGFNAVVVSTKVTCCTTDLCNTSGASSIKFTYTILVVALGFLGALMSQLK
ncbi:lymphocyte antigen 6E-like [Rana temporaria]|uniref:lymphocyte antigen 6E-like n=1 Tax=Rana temporaria TaxID=8407 RepID=UPI001AACB1BF|nr:lymphocyte antigen 6E-like [Rana temporaria]